MRTELGKRPYREEPGRHGLSECAPRQCWLCPQQVTLNTCTGGTLPLRLSSQKPIRQVLGLRFWLFLYFLDKVSRGAQVNSDSYTAGAVSSHRSSVSLPECLWVCTITPQLIEGSYRDFSKLSGSDNNILYISKWEEFFLIFLRALKLRRNDKCLRQIC